MKSYYHALAAERLERCYAIAPARIRRHLEAEATRAAEAIRPRDRVLDLGCGYGRTLLRFHRKCGWVAGVDISRASLRLARSRMGTVPGIHLLQMNAAAMGFKTNTFEVVVCIQNGISAFHLDKKQLVTEAMRVTRRGGTVLFATYSERFWHHRLDWFERQSHAGLIGPVDYARTGNGRIVCRDGFTAETVPPSEFRRLTEDLAMTLSVEEVDESSIFYRMTPA